MHPTEMWMGGPWGGGAGFGFFPFWPLLMIFFWFGFARLIGGGHRGRHSRAYGPPQVPTQVPTQDPALVTLRDRFARGEIDRAEYEERRAILLGRQQATEPIPGGHQGADASSEAKRSEHGPEWPDLV